MSDELNKIAAVAVSNQEQATEALEKLLAVAQPKSVFGEPIAIGEYTLITASEVVAGMGFGYGFGGGSAPAPAAAKKEDKSASASESPPANEPSIKPNEAGGMGGGGGGGGSSMARPVAVIKLAPNGSLQVEPIVDVTKLGIAFFTTLGAMLLMWSRMNKLSRKG